MKTNLLNRTWRLIAGMFFALTFLMILSERGYAKDTVYVTSDLTTATQGNLNAAISDVITADPTGNQLSNTVFKLELYGYYILTGTITTPRHSHLTIVAPEPGNTQEKAPPQIVWTSSGGVSQTFSFDCFGDLTMKNIWILCANISGAQVGSSIVIEDDTLASESGKGQRLEMDGCIIDYMSIGNGGGAITPACRNFRGKITNTYFRNMTDPHFKYYGRPVSWVYGSTTWHTDSLIFENCTIANVGYAYAQEAPEYADYVSFNHCTFVNTMMFTLESSYWWWLSVTNCLFVNSYMMGTYPAENGFFSFGTGGMISIDSIAILPYSFPFTDDPNAPKSQQRHILFANNSYGYEQWYIDYLNNNPFYPANDLYKIHRMPMMNKKTYRFLTSMTGVTKNFPYMNMINMHPEVDTIADLPATYNAGVDPQFFLSPTNIDGIKNFLYGRWFSGDNVNWAFNPQEDVQQVWPMSENLAYTNGTLKTAAMSGFPLGDLYHWWPADYPLWKAQKEAEQQFIVNALTYGTGLVLLNTPELISPALNIQNQPVDSLTMQWHSVSDASGYIFQLSSNPTFTQFVANDSTADTLFTVKSLKTSTKYYWRVRAYSNDGSSQFSSMSSFTTLWAMPTTPTLISPISNAVDQSAKIKLICSKTSDAVQYHWQVSFDTSFLAIALQDSTIDTTFTTTPLLAGTKFYWKVRGMNPEYVGDFSSVDSFTVMKKPSQPVLVSPKSIAGMPPTFVWRSVFTATAYHLQVAKNNFPTSNLVIDLIVEDTTITDTLNCETYFWRVSAINIGGEGDFSGSAFFNIECGLAVQYRDEIPKEFALFQNYPNPFNPSTTLSFALAVKSFVSLKIFDIIGREVETIVSEELSSGYYQKLWDSGSLAGGVYFYRIQAGTFQETKKLIILK